MSGGPSERSPGLAADDWARKRGRPEDKGFEAEAVGLEASEKRRSAARGRNGPKRRRHGAASPNRAPGDRSRLLPRDCSVLNSWCSAETRAKLKPSTPALA